MLSVKYFIKEFIPPIFIRLLNGKKTYRYGCIGRLFNIRKNGYYGFYNSWKDATNKTSGYGIANIIKKVKK